MFQWAPEFGRTHASFETPAMRAPQDEVGGVGVYFRST
jgi:hypothetical protein